MKQLISIAVTFFFLSFGAYANDTAASISPQGIEFTAAPEISLDEEILSISLDQISVNYVFLNQSKTPLTRTIAFPLPPSPDSKGNFLPNFPEWDVVYRAYSMLYTRIKPRGLAPWM